MLFIGGKISLFEGAPCSWGKWLIKSSLGYHVGLSLFYQVASSPLPTPAPTPFFIKQNYSWTEGSRIVSPYPQHCRIIFIPPSTPAPFPTLPGGKRPEERSAVKAGSLGNTSSFTHHSLHLPTPPHRHTHINHTVLEIAGVH